MVFHNVEDARRATFGPRREPEGRWKYRGQWTVDAIPAGSKLERAFIEEFGVSPVGLHPLWTPEYLDKGKRKRGAR